MSERSGKVVTISVEEYVRLLVADEALSRLQAGGVDNWEGYGDSLNPDDQPGIGDYRDDLKERYFGEG